MTAFFFFIVLFCNGCDKTRCRSYIQYLSCDIPRCPCENCTECSTELKTYIDIVNDCSWCGASACVWHLVQYCAKVGTTCPGCSISAVVLSRSNERFQKMGSRELEDK